MKHRQIDMDTKDMMDQSLSRIMIMSVDKLAHRSEYKIISLTGKRENATKQFEDVVDQLVHALVATKSVGLTRTPPLSYRYQTNQQAPQIHHLNALERTQDMIKVRVTEYERPFNMYGVYTQNAHS